MTTARPSSSSGCRRKSDPAAGTPAAGRSNLDPEGNKSDERHNSPSLILAPHKCKCRACRECGPKRGYQTRQELLSVQHLFRKPQLLTITIDPKVHATPKAALDHVREKECISRLMRKLGIDHWFWVLEFQRNGYPHWHLLVDAPGSGRIDYRRAQRLSRELGMGNLHFDRVKLDGPQHALMYVTKYLTKHPRLGYPAWLYELERMPRMFAMSRTVSSARKHQAPPAEESVPGAPRRTTGATVADRVALCGESSLLLAEHRLSDGSRRLEYLGRIDANRWDLFALRSKLAPIWPETITEAGKAYVRLRISCPPGVPPDRLTEKIQNRLSSARLRDGSDPRIRYPEQRFSRVECRRLYLVNLDSYSNI